jgi:hypothetical protein
MATTAVSSLSVAGVKNVPYPEVKVRLEPIYNPDVAFTNMRNAMALAITKKDSNALFALIAPTFVWTRQGQLASELDLGSEPLHNFKVVFGFRALGAEIDGGVENGPFWDILAALAEDGSFYKTDESGKLVCSPAAAEVIDEPIFEQARQKIDSGNEGVEWYFTLAEVGVAKSPKSGEPPIARVGHVALPVLSAYPTSGTIGPTHLEVLLPSGRAGWVPASAVRPLSRIACVTPRAQMVIGRLLSTTKPSRVDLNTLPSGR